ncbi:Hsp70 family protein [Methylobacter sp.]|uniref:Hsp70 family protein n=1 Tax=Methylobacter sp. TaxID=2051955 RepID=UPI0024894BEF|nr:Hsp70 family protein [Methylobacter sp.]MDI1278568.1 hsp70 family protein [Methylobacter sp.]MDI1359386.1 hsp70 family protein [Methylobacter sp.]
MKNPNLNYLVGIDLGTTHTVVAYAKADNTQQEIQIFQIEQLIAPGQVAARPLLPSVRYHPASGELSEADLAFPCGTPSEDETAVIGEAARLLGAKSKGRFVTSAKSWLSHPSVDHGADILPWGSSDDISKVSPIAASASYLSHIRTVWGHQFPDGPLEKQDIVITVPASFDEAARSLTLEAARLAGLPNVRLLEEPQAVCYDWLRRHAGTIKQALANVHLLLVCDVGGGTTDLTLIKVEQGEQEPKLTRIGVGDHLMLGGDNIDLALAHLAESRLGNDEKRLSAADLSQLIEQCRIAKERLLAEDGPEQINVTLLGGGSKLIGGSRSVALSKDEVRKIALDGFFPLSGLDDLPDRKRSGVVEFGLPYAAEPAVSKHIAAFLKLHSAASREAFAMDAAYISMAIEAGSVPDALLLNGGVFRSQPITRRLVDLIQSWRASPPVLLENKHPELSVAFGAVSYAIARRDKKLKIGGGSARSYFLLVDTDDSTAQQGICILPKGSEEGDEVILKDRRFALRLGVPVRFHLVSLSGDGEFKPGDVTEITDLFHSLPPLAVAFEGDDSKPNAEVIVELAVTQTEVGTLKIQCIAAEDSSRRWDVEFQIRKKAAGLQTDAALPGNFNQIAEQIQAVFGAKSRQIDPKAVKSLRADLEKLTGVARTEWTTPLLRAMFGTLLEGAKYQRRSENHERVWLSLAGFCLRPGFGYPLDDWRVEQLWKNYSQGIQFVNETQNWTEWWTLWRRISGGLDTVAQEKIFADIAKFLNPAAARQPGVAKQIKNRGYDDMVRLAAVLERLPVAKKIQLGEWLLKRLEKAGEPSQTWWAVGRIGARMPFHGSSHNVIPADIVCRWLQQMLAVDWKKIPQAGFAATLIARMSGDRARDIDEAMRLQVIEKLKLSKAPASWVDMVEQVKELDEKEEKQIFGEALPPGLKLINEA